MKFLALGLLVSLTSISVAASASVVVDDAYLTVSNLKINEIRKDVLGNELKEIVYQRSNLGIPQIPNQYGDPTPIDQAGKVIGVAKDLVALGEDVYNLVIKGKPNVKTDYAPISVIPKVNGEPADILETENWKMPKSVTYELVYENVYGMDVVTFRYSLIYSYGGSYNGKGQYLTAVQVIPEQVSVLFGYDFSAKMKLGGIANHGTRDNPLAAATIILEHEVRTVVKGSLSTAAFQVVGNGNYKKIR